MDKRKAMNMQTSHRNILAMVGVAWLVACGLNGSNGAVVVQSRDYLLVYIVDDSDTARMIAEHRVQAAATSSTVIATRSFSSGGEAIRVIDQDKPDLCVTDLNMPGVDGRAVTKRCRELGIPVIMITSQGNADFGASEVVAKKDVQDHLAGAVRRHLKIEGI